MSTDLTRETPIKSLLSRLEGVKPTLAEELIAHILSQAPGPGPLLVAISGGGDSVALSRLLLALAPERGWRLTLGHVDHGLRPDSAADAAWVVELARSLGLPCLIRRVAVRPTGHGLEDAARQARRAALAGMAAQVGSTTIALAHSLDDQAETLLLRLLSGTGPTGLAGMRLLDRPWWRPLLGARRDQLRDLLVQLGQEWLEDPSNADPRHARNRARTWLPRLAAEFNPRAPQALGRLAGLAAEEEAFWQAWGRDFLATHAQRQGQSLVIDSGAMSTLHPAQQRRLVRLAAGVLRGGGQHLQARHVEQVLGLMAGAPGRELPLAAGLWAAREAGGLRLARAGARPGFAWRLDGPGWLWLGDWPGWLRVEEAAGPPLLAARGPEAWLPARAVRWPLVVRSPRPGERFQPLGAPGRKRLSRILIDRKAPPWQRRRTVLVEDQEGPWWAGPWCLHQRAWNSGQDGPWLRLVLVDTGTPPPYTNFFEISPLYPGRTPPVWGENRQPGDDP